MARRSELADPLHAGCERRSALRGSRLDGAPGHELSAGLIACWAFFLAAWWRSEGARRSAERRRREYGLKPAGITLSRLDPRQLEAAALWTDAYSDIFGVLKRKHTWGRR